MLNDKQILLMGALSVLVYMSMVYFLPALADKFTANVSKITKVSDAMCSPDCCKKQWPPGFGVKRDPRVKKGELGTKYVPNNMNCTGQRGRGCPCLTKNQLKVLRSRGGNH
jgi:hypothetical protein